MPDSTPPSYPLRPSDFKRMEEETDKTRQELLALQKRISNASKAEADKKLKDAPLDSLPED